MKPSSGLSILQWGYHNWKGPLVTTILLPSVGRNPREGPQKVIFAFRQVHMGVGDHVDFVVWFQGRRKREDQAQRSDFGAAATLAYLAPRDSHSIFGTTIWGGIYSLPFPHRGSCSPLSPSHAGRGRGEGRSSRAEALVSSAALRKHSMQLLITPPCSVHSAGRFACAPWPPSCHPLLHGTPGSTVPMISPCDTTTLMDPCF